jgi:hypothetical protein
MNSNRRIYGVDFSGAKKAGNKIWITSGHIVDGTLFAEGCFPAHEIPNGGRDRQQCLNALVDFVASNHHAVFGFDFPFSLPADVVPDTSDWETFVTGFSNEFRSPQDFYESCKSRGGELPGEKIEYKRTTDKRAEAPFCPYNLRIKSQTYYGIRDLLSPLVEEEKACILPMQTAEESKPWVLEICPSSTLRHEELPRQGYKDSGASAESVREQIVKGLENMGVRLPEGIRHTAIEETDGDALDSIIALVAAARAAYDRPDVDANRSEGHIYV